MAKAKAKANKQFDAVEARKMAEAVKPNDSTANILVNIVLDEVKRAAKRGEVELRDPWRGIRMMYSNRDADLAVARLKQLGFGIANHQGSMVVEW